MKDNSEKIDLAIEALADFVIRVSKDGATSEAEIVALPEVAKTLLTLFF